MYTIDTIWILDEGGRNYDSSEDQPWGCARARLRRKLLANVVKEITAAIESIRVDKRKCRILVNECTALIDALTDGSLDLETHEGVFNKTERSDLGLECSKSIEKCLAARQDFTQELRTMIFMFNTNTLLEQAGQQQEMIQQQQEALRQL
ncbi:hypothetical protein FISHEDRAFT_62931 [Fistulina hepatica ATCC 64428]|uniref:Uncharacterized protein n=1 Tax=Fistulina hepatica ATCC 64428 TaxID=1128425 RepID=A0A0D6ZZT7_9AGAR|nr:hypothetical protein FISHEDRAFT_62931 [Fistulina hepatica ATCC 64428]